MKSNLKLSTLLFALLFTCGFAKAQGGFDGRGSSQYATDANGGALMTAESVDSGNPFFSTDWVKADVKFKNGNEQKDKVVKYSDLKDILYTQAPGNQYGLFDTPVSEFTIYNTDGTTAHFSVFPGNGKTADDAFFQVLADGKVKLLKKNAKAISESKAGIGTAVVTKMVVDNIDYYLLIDGKAVRIKKDKKAIETALGSKQTELDAYIQTNKLSLKKDEDVAKLITYYNTL
ncbi:MAG TPA: hypothetical protein VL490_00815 [Mucilaginibacter sp.]|jgi:hypothetical protein|nr:hypothetical protein [Mucilaginibacter sp.]